MAKDPALRDVLRFPADGVADLDDLDRDRFDPRATPSAPGGKKATRRAIAADTGPELASLQERHGGGPPLH